MYARVSLQLKSHEHAHRAKGGQVRIEPLQQAIVWVSIPNRLGKPDGLVVNAPPLSEAFNGIVVCKCYAPNGPRGATTARPRHFVFTILKFICALYESNVLGIISRADVILGSWRMNV